MRRIILAVAAIVLILAANAYAEPFNGYEEIRWGTLFHKIMEVYPKGNMTEYNKQLVYTQDKPDETIASRMFAFKDGLLTSVSVTFEAKYVTKTGLENLKQQFIKKYGKGKPGAQSSHMASYIWEGKQTRVSFIYVPKRPDMTVIQYEKK